MRKKISVDDLTVGMYLSEMVGAWLKNPFWRSSFVIADARQISLIKASPIREVWIDASKGKDVVSPAAPAPVLFDPSPPAVPAPLHAGDTSSMVDELARAADICARSKSAVASMFREARMGNAVDGEAANRVVQEITDSLTRNSRALISLARLKTADDYTYMHSVAVCAMMAVLARALSMDSADIRAAAVAGLLHDMGKALLPIHVLNKPGKLTPAEFAIVKTHPERGHKLLASSGLVEAMVLDVCLHHHEKADGSGYPEAITAAEMSVYAKMGAVCDVYDAITSNRPYKSGWDPAESIRMMGQWAADGHFDTGVFQVFVKSLGIYPVGSLVRLASGRIGVVVDQNPSALTAPVVKVFYDCSTKQRITPETLDLAARAFVEKIVAREDPAKWKFSDLNELWSGLPGLDR